MAGAQVVPILGYGSQEYLATMFRKVNGLLFPGGAMDFDLAHPWTRNAKYLFDLAAAENRRGEVFPVFGTCLGFELISFIVSASAGECNPLSNITQQSKVIRPVTFLQQAEYFAGMDP
jgi:hypothetical protein